MMSLQITIEMGTINLENKLQFYLTNTYCMREEIAVNNNTQRKTAEKNIPISFIYISELENFRELVCTF